MRLDAGGIRELHWHQAAEWAFMSYGNCRITVLDPQGRAYVADVKEGDLWYFPIGYPHSLQGLGPDGCEFILAFNDGKQSEYNTLLVTDWVAHTPPDVLAENFGVPAETFSKIFTHNLWIFQGAVPGPLAADQDAVKSPNGPPPNPFTYSLGSGPIAKADQGRHRPDRRQPEFQGCGGRCGCARDHPARWNARDALASECRRVAVLCQRIGANDRLQHRAESGDHEFQGR